MLAILGVLGDMSKARGKEHLEQRLGHTFANRFLLEQALSPPSAGLSQDNQRMEFLGDAILQVCVSHLIFSIQPGWREGSMSKLRGMLVCTDSLKAWASDLGLALTRGPRSPKGAPSISPGKPMADALEALIAAVYLDEEAQGREGLTAAKRVVSQRFEPLVRQAYEGIWADKDAKTTLQETAAALGFPPPVYELLEKSGPDHAPRFLVRVQVGPIEAREAAQTLKMAQTQAAREALLRMKSLPK